MVIVSFLFFPCGPLVTQITFSGTGVPECSDVVINITRTKCLPIILDDAIFHQSGSSGGRPITNEGPDGGCEGETWSSATKNKGASRLAAATLQQELGPTHQAP